MGDLAHRSPEALTPSCLAGSNADPAGESELVEGDREFPPARRIDPGPRADASRPCESTDLDRRVEHRFLWRDNALIARQAYEVKAQVVKSERLCKDGHGGSEADMGPINATCVGKRKCGERTERFEQPRRRTSVGATWI